MLEEKVFEVNAKEITNEHWWCMSIYASVIIFILVGVVASHNIIVNKPWCMSMFMLLSVIAYLPFLLWRVEKQGGNIAKHAFNVFSFLMVVNMLWMCLLVISGESITPIDTLLDGFSMALLLTLAVLSLAIGGVKAYQGSFYALPFSFKFLT